MAEKLSTISFHRLPMDIAFLKYRRRRIRSQTTLLQIFPWVWLLRYLARQGLGTLPLRGIINRKESDGKHAAVDKVTRRAGQVACGWINIIWIHGNWRSIELSGPHYPGSEFYRCHVDVFPRWN